MIAILPAPWDLEYDPTQKDTVKELGGMWDPDGKVWVLPDEAEIPLKIQHYVLDRQ